jgi:hypothetical protein
VKKGLTWFEQKYESWHMVENMVKYYGEPGTRVGKYRSAKLGASFVREEFLDNWGGDPTFASPAKDIDAYLTRAGKFISTRTDHKERYIYGSRVYHYGGATVVVNYGFSTSLSEGQDAGDVTVRLVSNDHLVHVVERLRKKFPYLQQGKSFDGID